MKNDITKINFNLMNQTNILYDNNLSLNANDPLNQITLLNNKILY